MISPDMFFLKNTSQKSKSHNHKNTTNSSHKLQPRLHYSIKFAEIKTANSKPQLCLQNHQFYCQSQVVSQVELIITILLGAFCRLFGGIVCRCCAVVTEHLLCQTKPPKRSTCAIRFKPLTETNGNSTELIQSQNDPQMRSIQQISRRYICDMVGFRSHDF